MKRIGQAIAMTMIIGLAAARADQPTTQPSGTIKAFRRVKIEASSPYLDTVHQFESDSNDMIYTVDGANAHLPMYGINMIQQGALNDVATLSISVELSPNGGDGFEAAERADSILSQLRARLAILTQKQREVWKSQVESLYRQDQSLRKQLISQENRLKLFDNDVDLISTQVGLADVSPQSLRGLAQALEAEYEATGVNTEGKTARQTAIADAIAKLSVNVESKLGADPIAQQLQQVVDARQKEVDRETMESKAGAVPQADLDRDTAALAEAKAAVLERKETAAAAAGADTIHKWNDDLLSLSVDMAELHARQEALKSRIAALKNALGTVEAMPSIESLHKSIDELNDQASKLEAESIPAQAGLAAALPKLTVIESTNEPAVKN